MEERRKEILGVDIEIQWQVRGNHEKPWDPFLAIKVVDF